MQSARKNRGKIKNERRQEGVGVVKGKRGECGKENGGVKTGTGSKSQMLRMGVGGRRVESGARDNGL